MIEPLTYFLLLLKASLFTTGGLANLPSVYQDMLARGWAREDDFGQAIAVGQVSPGPNGLWIVSFGYLTYGWLGAGLALLAIIIPPFVVLGIQLLYNRIQTYPAVQAVIRGISLAVVGMILTVAWSLISSSGTDWRAWCIALVAFAVGITRRVSPAIMLGVAALAGYLIYGL